MASFSSSISLYDAYISHYYRIPFPGVHVLFLLYMQPVLFVGIQCLNVLRLRDGVRSTLAIGLEAEKLLGTVLF